MKKTDEIIAFYKRYILNTYGKNPVVLVRGEGSRVWDIEGNPYLDFFPGWGVNGLGHCHPRIVAAIKQQAEKLIHVPNNYYNELQGNLGRRIVETAFSGKCFFCNSGAEANEGAIKLARAFGTQKGRYEIVTMERSFHGRTMATVTATGQPRYQQGFAPLLPGFRYAKLNDMESLRKVVGAKTCAVMLEIIQGEGGVHPATPEYLKALRKFCDDHHILLVVDEVQTGMGRTGTYFAYQHFGMEPDIMTLAKSLGGGVAIGALLAREELSGILQPGSHASTFGGNPLASAAALAAFDVIDEESILENVMTMGVYLREKLEEIKSEFDIVHEVRGRGLMWGTELTVEGTGIVTECLRNGVLINCTAGNVLRFMPALNITRQEIDQVLSTVQEAMKKCR